MGKPGGHARDSGVTGNFKGTVVEDVTGPQPGDHPNEGELPGVEDCLDG